MRRRERGRRRRSSGGGASTSIGSRIKRGTIARRSPIVSCRRLECVSFYLEKLLFSPTGSLMPKPYLLQIRHLKQQQLLQQQFWLERQRDAKGVAGRCPSFSPSRRTPFLVQHHPLPASGMTAIFLSSSGARKEPTGTGVFLPRTSNSKPQPQKKSGNPHPQHQPIALQVFDHSFLRVTDYTFVIPFSIVM